MYSMGGETEWRDLVRTFINESNRIYFGLVNSVIIKVMDNDDTFPEGIENFRATALINS